MDPTLEYARVRLQPPWFPPEARSIQWFDTQTTKRENSKLPSTESGRGENRQEVNEQLIRDGDAAWADYPFSAGSLGLRLAPAFANIDAVADFTRRRGGYLGRSEPRDFTAAASGSFALEALAYVHYRFPDSITLLVADRDNVAAQYKGSRGYGALPAWLSPLATEPSHYTAEEAIVRRFPDPINLLVCDLGFPLDNVEKLVKPDGYLICIAPPHLRSPAATHFIAEVASRFASWTVFHPLALLGERAVVVATGSRMQTAVDKDAIIEKISAVMNEFEDAEPHIWSDRNFYDHRRCAVAWNVL